MPCPLVNCKYRNRELNTYLCEPGMEAFWSTLFENSNRTARTSVLHCEIHCTLTSPITTNSDPRRCSTILLQFQSLQQKIAGFEGKIICCSTKILCGSSSNKLLQAATQQP